MSIHRPTIHLWAPGIREGSGGIQGFCRDLLAALIRAFPHNPIHVLIKNDRPEPNDPLFGANVRWTSVCTWPGPLKTIGFALLGGLRCARQRPGVIVCGHVNFLPAVRWFNQQLKMPHVTFMYGIDVWTRLSDSIRSGLHESAALFSISNHTTQQAVVAQELGSKRIDHFPCTFATTRYVPGPKPPVLLERYGLRPDQPVLFTVSRLAASEQYKGHEQILQALPTVAKTSPDVRYIIGGTGDYADTLKQRAAELGLADRVIFAGFIPNQELAAHYQLCDAFVMPSRKEGFGIVFLEAMGCGKPVIGGNQDGSVDALDGGRLGVLIDPLNIAELAESICQILTKTHPNRLLFDPQALHDAAVATFGPDAFRQRLQDALVPLLKSRSQ